MERAREAAQTLYTAESSAYPDRRSNPNPNPKKKLEIRVSDNFEFQFILYFYSIFPFFGVSQVTSHLVMDRMRAVHKKLRLLRIPNNPMQLICDFQAIALMWRVIN